MGGITRRELLAGAAGLAAGMAVADLALAQGKEKVTILTPFTFLIGFAELLYPLSAGYYAEQGLDATVLPASGSAAAVTQVLAGQAQFCRTGAIDLMTAVSRGAPLVAIATIAQASTIWMISPAKAPINSPEDFKGKTIGIISKAGLAENLLDMMLAGAKIDPKSVPREAVGNAPGAFSLIEQGRIAGYLASTSTVLALKAAGTPIVAWNTDQFAKIPGQVLVTTREMVEKRPETCQKFLNAVNMAVTELLDPNKIDAAIAKMKPLEISDAKDPAAAKAALLAEQASWSPGGIKPLRNVPDRFSVCRFLMVGAGLLPQGASDQVYTNQFAVKLS